MSAQGLSAIAAAISALAALCALYAVRNTNKIARASITPVLSLHYDNEKITIKNVGKGAALNLRLEPNTIHWLDIKQLRHLEMQTGNIQSGESKSFPLKSKNPRDSKGSVEPADAFDFFYQAKNSSKAGIIYDDVAGGSYLIRLRFIEEPTWSLETKRIYSYKIWRRVSDWFVVKFYVKTGKIREQRFEKNHMQGKK